MGSGLMVVCADDIDMKVVLSVSFVESVYSSVVTIDPTVEALVEDRV